MRMGMLFWLMGLVALNWMPEAKAQTQALPYCANKAASPDFPAQRVCFKTYIEARDFLIDEPENNDRGYRFLTETGIPVPFGSAPDHLLIQHFIAGYQSVDEFENDYFSTSGLNTVWMKGGQACPEPISCPDAPILGTNARGCDTESDAAHSAAVTVWCNCVHGVEGCAPEFVGEWRSSPPWEKFSRDLLTNKAKVIANFTATTEEVTQPRGVVFQVAATGNPPSHRFHGTTRKDVWYCPAGIEAVGFMTAEGHATSWPRVCRRKLESNITYLPKRVDTCPAAGENPCKPATGAKEYFEEDVVFGQLTFSRYYSSLVDSAKTTGFPGSNWSHSFAARFLIGATTSNFGRQDERGNIVYFRSVSTNKYVSQSNDSDFVVRNVDGTFTYFVGGGATETYDVAGRLLARVTSDPGTSFTLEYCTTALIAAEECLFEGALHRAVAATGRALTFIYSARTATDNFGVVGTVPALDEIRADDSSVLVAYEYDAMGRLVAAERSPLDRATFHYGEAASLCQPSSSAVVGCDPLDFPHFLTRVERPGGDVRVYSYDGLGKALSTSLALPETVTLVDYPSANAASVLNPSGSLITYSFQSAPPYRPLSKTTFDSSTNQTLTESWTYDGNGRRQKATDANGRERRYFYDSAVITRIENWSGPTGTRQRSTLETRDANTNRRLALQVRDSANVVKQRTSWTYNTRGQVLTQTQTDPVTSATRVMTYTYCESGEVSAPGSTCPILGLLKSVDGPRTDVADIVTYTYFAASDESGCASTGPCHRKGDLWKVTNALGHEAETLRYDLAGRVKTSKDSNDVITEFTWHSRGWLLTRTVKGATTPEDATITFAYDATGQVTRTTQPDGDYLDYEYDAAHRLTAIEDALGNRIEYTVDAAGNRTAESTKDTGGTVKRSLSRVYDQLGRLEQQLDAQSNVTGFDYDANGNMVSTEDALSTETEQTYDPLDRLRSTIQDVGGLDVEAEYAYDPLDRLTKVTDPKGLDTVYTYDGLGNLTQLSSPDTGTTTYTYDAAGNRLTQTDARLITATYAYDALNRLASISYVDSAQNVSFDYDQADGTTGCAASFPTGRLTRMTDASGSTTYCYGRRGNITRKTQVTGDVTAVVGYAYTLGDRISGVDYPSGMGIAFTYDASGRAITVARTAPTATDIVDNVTYLPFGPASQIAFDGGTTLDFAYDQNYWIDDVGGSALDLDLSTNAIGNIVGLDASTAGNERVYGYDALSRLTDVDDGNAALIEGFTYDGTGNRLSKQGPSSTQTYGYPGTSHRLTSIDATTRTYDAMGSLVDRGDGWTFEYDARQRLRFVRQSGTVVQTNGYSGKGERVTKQAGGATFTYVYDEAGKLVAEYRKAGMLPAAVQREYVWLDGRPIAIAVNTGTYAGEIVHVHSDHLGTPRAITRPAASNGVVWRWELGGAAFGDHAPSEDVDGDSHALVSNLRYPGQYFDVESGLHYNYFRDYEAGTGRYIESDPIGQRVGPNLYGYVDGSPLSFVDSLGLYLQCFRQVKTLTDFVRGRGNVEIGTYRGVTCVDLPGPRPFTPRPDRCENGGCESCEVKCWNEYSLSWPKDAVGPALAVGGLVAEAAAGAAVTTAAAAFTFPAACAVAGAGISGFELGTAYYCVLVCSPRLESMITTAGVAF